MKCAQCQEMGLRSRIRVGGNATTLMGWSPYYDEEGVYHAHNPNTIRTEYHCSQGHIWTGVGLKPCPTEGCTYGKES